MHLNRLELSQTHAYLGMICLAEGDFKGAIVHFEESWLHDPYNPDAAAGLAIAHDELDSDDERVGNQAHHVQLNLAVCSRELSRPCPLELAARYQGDAAAFRAEISEAKDDPSALFQRGRFLVVLDLLDLAIRYLDEVIRLDENAAEAFLFRAIAYRRQDDAVRADADLAAMRSILQRRRPTAKTATAGAD